MKSPLTLLRQHAVRRLTKMNPQAIRAAKALHQLEPDHPLAATIVKHSTPTK